MATFAEVLALMPQRHTITVEAHAGSGPYGDTYATAVTVIGYSYGKRRQVRGPQGAIALSAVTVLLPLDTVVTPRSRVTLPDGTVTSVIDVTRHHGGGLPTPDHLEIACE